MSGICGIVALDGQAPTESDIAAMTAKLERRGPDATRHWLGVRAALGHTLLATTPEALVEQLPLTDEASGCTVTADVRLDNREELLAALGIDAGGRVLGDGELILRAYLKWGEDCPKHLLGDFAFAIWDPGSASLFAARDQMGMRQLLYHHSPGHHFVFATETEAVLAHAAVPRRVNYGRIADFLDDFEGFDLTSTFFEEVYRLPPAHWLRVTEDAISVGRYWELRPGPPLILPSDQAYDEAFLEIFRQAVRCRLRSPGPVGAMLSGGMDSGSVAAVAATLMASGERGALPTFSAIGPSDEACVETETILAALALPNIKPTLIRHTELDAFADDLIQLTRDSAEPFDGHMVLIRAVYLAARRAGLKVVLDGVAGDVVLTAGNGIAESLRRGRIGQAVREAAGGQRFLGDTRAVWKALAKSAWVAFAPLSLRRFRRRWLWRGSAHHWRDGLQIDARFASQIRRDERRRLFWRHVRDIGANNREQRALAILHPNLVVGRERYDRVAAELGMEARDPFMDLRVINFCLSLPWSQLQSDGWPKLVLRRAMRGHLPEAVIWRRGKEHLGPKFIDALLRLWPGWRDQASKGIDGIARVGKPGLTQARNQVSAKALDREARTTVFYLKCWLRRGTGTATEALGDHHGGQSVQGNETRSP